MRVMERKFNEGTIAKVWSGLGEANKGWRSTPGLATLRAFVLLLLNLKGHRRGSWNLEEAYEEQRVTNSNCSVQQRNTAIAICSPKDLFALLVRRGRHSSLSFPASSLLLVPPSAEPSGSQTRGLG